ncbi:Crp/Fnr family transcriptional regulator [Chitinophaga niabensis]|uniref:cAMP-binding domain of CRP or a regulatory subunit of cAMP-dependent protein kinases n=1 Tax=Chitinophaga niabensis TaxID=536979 RepID=A0A1N6K829_9BACT|nr:Crp/Fnr family transcriptional regulator [Chitinophaga niabensis]SIO52744.1 cAMP-binding domain of CRP or a regulatory subunit of cAMP-dependent protein kinases [Chitinophaga niabensis]
MKYELPAWYDQLMKKYPIVTQEEWQVLDSIATVKRIKKGDAFLRSGKVARNAAFVISGIFKFSIPDEAGNEKIIKFALADDFLANCESYNKKAPSNVSIIAIEDAVILKINQLKLKPLYDQHINLLHVSLQLYQELLEQQSEHQHILALKTPLRRYRFLMERRPAIIQRISLTNIAKYLYISREALSRARLFLPGQRGNFCD